MLFRPLPDACLRDNEHWQRQKTGMSNAYSSCRFSKRLNFYFDNYPLRIPPLEGLAEPPDGLEGAGLLWDW